jgi:RNA polymerase sigma-70 factor (ECF subfamily)
MKPRKARLPLLDMYHYQWYQVQNFMSTSISAGIQIESWYRAYSRRLRGAAKRMLGNIDDAEDALQDAFVAAVRSYDGYDGRDPYPWLHRIATRKALNILAARRSRAGNLIASADEPSAEDRALAELAGAELIALVRSEPAFALHALGGLRFREVGARLGTPVATAATRIRRGKFRLRDRLKATLSGFPESRPA